MFQKYVQKKLLEYVTSLVLLKPPKYNISGCDWMVAGVEFLVQLNVKHAGGKKKLILFHMWSLKPGDIPHSCNTPQSWLKKHLVPIICWSHTRGYVCLNTHTHTPRAAKCFTIWLSYPVWHFRFTPLKSRVQPRVCLSDLRCVLHKNPGPINWARPTSQMAGARRGSWDRGELSLQCRVIVVSVLHLLIQSTIDRVVDCISLCQPVFHT